MGLFNLNVKSVLLLSINIDRKKDMHQSCRPKLISVYRFICNIFWYNRITNRELWELSGMDKVETTIKRRKWKSCTSIIQKILDYDVPRNKRVGKPRSTWKSTGWEEIMLQCKTWTHIKIAKDRNKMGSLMRVIVLNESVQ